MLPDCSGVGDLPSRIGDKWSAQILGLLHRRPDRWNSPRDNAAPVQCTLTKLGTALADPVRALATWPIDNRAAIRDSRTRFDAEMAGEAAVSI